jgi:GTP-binding protein HflX
VGFIRDLPHTLVASFRATLEETVHADLLLHVVDSASPVREQQIEDVNGVLREIGADSIPQIEVWNKIDLRGRRRGARAGSRARRVW